ncbi:hypothetical protein QFC21_005689 [Naganishia friedmannii]|uniref:Uncharacterized protein n=1 Tax=Naganishia friedmannii TaxID=89922 RepID=A0ACC2V868_9TREE|nr:hypothetical protein QFC21_005689 [Naganishia friedmannii]
MQNHFEPSDQMANSRNASFPNVTDTFAGEADLPFCPSGLAFLDATSHLISHPKIKDWLQLLLLGLAAELARRIGTKLCVWARYVFCITSSHYMNDEAYDWLMAYWMHDPTWQERGRRFIEPIRIRKERQLKLVSFLVNGDAGAWYMMWLGWTLVILHRKAKKNYTWHSETEVLEVTMLTTSRQRFEDLLLLAKEAYLVNEEDKITVKMVDESEDTGEWREVATKYKRPLSSVVTEASAKEKLERDMIGFLEAENCLGLYSENALRSLGVPGSGKTSVIHALASACDLDIYVVSLATAGGVCCSMEGIDVSMPEGSSTLNRQGDDETDDEDEDNDSEGSSKRKDSANRSVTRGSAVTLSGLLNAIDGVAGSEGRILFMTTNHIEKLDPALIRPGRADIRVEFKNANKSMCRDLFKVFYPVTGEYPVEYARASDVRPSVSAALPEREFSPAQIQGMLMMHRVYPGEALDAIPTWIEAKRKEKADEERKKEQVAEAKTSKEEEGTTKNGADKKAKEDVTGVQEVLTVAVETKHSPAS